MTNNLNKTLYGATLLIGLLLFPFLGFSQQEQPKRAAITVNVREITPQKDIVHLPANNTPRIIGQPKAKNIKKVTPLAKK